MWRVESFGSLMFSCHADDLLQSSNSIGLAKRRRLHKVAFILVAIVSMTNDF